MTDRRNESKRSGETSQKCRETEQVSGLLCCPPVELTSDGHINALYRGNRCRSQWGRFGVTDSSRYSGSGTRQTGGEAWISNCQIDGLEATFGGFGVASPGGPALWGQINYRQSGKRCRCIPTLRSQGSERRHSIARDTWARVECQTPTDSTHGCYACASPMRTFSSAPINSRQRVNNWRQGGGVTHPGSRRHRPRWSA